jgi:protein ImuA
MLQVGTENRVAHGQNSVYCLYIQFHATYFPASYSHYGRGLMMNSELRIDPEGLHPALWFASQLARASQRCVDTGYPALSQQLPGNGWPTGCLIDLLLQQPGIGELRLLAPALAGMGARPIVLLQPAHIPQTLAFAELGVSTGQLVWLRTQHSADALWAAEQTLRSGCCGALLFWAQHARAESLRRLHLAAQQGETLFCMMRPLASRQDASPAQLRLALRPAQGGVWLDFVKRRGPQRDEALFLTLPSPVLFDRHAPVDSPAPAPTATRSVLPELVA